MIWKITAFICFNIFSIQYPCIDSTNLLRYEFPTWIDDLLEIDYDVKCKMQANSYDCSQWQNASSSPRYYYDIKMQACRTFDYFECKVSLNNFLSLFECNEHCREAGIKRTNVTKPTVYCRLQPDFGDCSNYHPMFYYDITSRGCKGFSYGGCGGNKNKFENSQQCVAVCSGIVAMMNK